MNKKNFKRILALLITCVVFLLSFASFAEEKENASPTWAVCVYLIDNERTTKYNNSILSEISHSFYNKNVTVVSETSWSTPFDTFMKYCATNVPADHRVLIIAGEGEGVYGLRKDNYSYTTLNDIESGLKRCFTKDEKDPEFDLTLIDGSLMSCIEMGKIFDGYSKYLIAAESLMYNGKGFYLKWFGDLTRNTSVDAFSLGKNIIDAYGEMIEKEVKKNGDIISTNICLLDVAKLYKVYESYEKLAKSAMKRIHKDNLFLSYLSDIAKKTVTAGDSGDLDFSFNMIDIYDFAHNLRKAFPVESINIKRALKGAVKYKKEAGFTQNTCGVSVYFPRVGFAGHEALLKEYGDNVAPDYVKALYDYKMRGKLDEKSQKVIKDELKFTLKDIDFLPLLKIKDINPTVDNTTKFTFELSDEMKELKQDAYLMVYKREKDSFVLYNEDNYMNFGRDNNIHLIFDCKWDALNDAFLPVNLLSTTKDYKKYFTNIIYNDTDAKLILNYDDSLRGTQIVGIAVDYPATRLVGSIISPLKNGEAIGLYDRVLDLVLKLEKRDDMKVFRYNSNYKIDYKTLIDGEYTMAIVYEDIRGVRHTSGNIDFNMRDGALFQIATEKDLFAKE